MIQELISPLVIPFGCGAAMALFFGRSGASLAAATLATVLAWKFQDEALIIAGFFLAVFLFMNLSRLVPAARPDKNEIDDTVIDVEFKVVEANDDRT